VKSGKYISAVIDGIDSNINSYYSYLGEPFVQAVSDDTTNAAFNAVAIGNYVFVFKAGAGFNISTSCDNGRNFTTTTYHATNAFVQGVEVKYNAKSNQIWALNRAGTSTGNLSRFTFNNGALSQALIVSDDLTADIPTLAVGSAQALGVVGENHIIISILGNNPWESTNALDDTLVWTEIILPPSFDPTTNRIIAIEGDENRHSNIQRRGSLLRFWISQMRCAVV